MRFCVLGSGSKGNATYIASDKAAVLVDAGLGITNLKAKLSALGVSLSQLSGVLVTHEHGDHIKTIGVLSEKYGIPIYASIPTMELLRKKFGNQLTSEAVRVFQSGEEFYIKDLAVRPFKIPHDAADPHGYSIFNGAKKVSCVTDLGYISNTVMENVSDSNILLIEANHDLDMLRHGPYSEWLKRRIMSRKGHLSNDDCACALIKLIEKNVRTVVLGHRSEENNSEECIYRSIHSKLAEHGIQVGADMRLELASQHKPTALYVSR